MNGRAGDDRAPTGANASSRHISIAEAGGGGSDRTKTSGVADAAPASTPSRYEAQKRRDWNTFGQYLQNHQPPLPLVCCSGSKVLEFLRYLDQFGKTKVHVAACPYFGLLHPPSPCGCPLRQAWGSLDALIGRLRAAYEEHGGRPESNPFGARIVRAHLREVRELQAKARGMPRQKKKRKPRPKLPESSSSSQLPPPSAPIALPSAAPSSVFSMPMVNPIHLLSAHEPRYSDRRRPPPSYP
ncbi:hypothetical protein O6H91_01G018900 [Diphasiastrum complanatum]|uniref:Uncharacterized protein n=1 Tax=Diphasiastrum complanatum TaxID=34168 RepID=A0ACC2ENU6_DIPCM|nr:hypothetical protein O6H91_01G018900 [Diphasiastrum complanatum]